MYNFSDMGIVGEEKQCPFLQAPSQSYLFAFIF